MDCLKLAVIVLLEPSLNDEERQSVITELQNTENVNLKII